MNYEQKSENKKHQVPQVLTGTRGLINDGEWGFRHGRSKPRVVRHV